MLEENIANNLLEPVWFLLLSFSVFILSLHFKLHKCHFIFILFHVFEVSNRKHRNNLLLFSLFPIQIYDNRN